MASLENRKSSDFQPDQSDGINYHFYVWCFECKMMRVSFLSVKLIGFNNIYENNVLLRSSYANVNNYARLDGCNIH